MSFKNIILLLIVSISTYTCKNVDPNNQIDEGNIENNVYKSNEIGWEMEIPKGWEIVTMEETKSFQEKGTDFLEDIAEAEIDVSKLRNLLSFKKGLFNMFQSTSEPYEIEYEGEWEENAVALKEFLYDAYTQQGIKVSVSDTTTELIDGLEFQLYTFSLYGPDDEVILNQMMYSTLTNGYDFGVNINYNNDTDKNEMLKAFQNSKFRKSKTK